MGVIPLPTAGPVYVDSDSLIYSVEQIEPYRTLLQPVWSAARAGRFLVISSDLIVLETLVKPFRTQDGGLEREFRAVLFNTREFTLYRTTEGIMEEAARLRAAIPTLKTPDAIHAATALVNKASLFLTNDPKFRQISVLPLQILDDLVS